MLFAQEEVGPYDASALIPSRSPPFPVFPFKQAKSYGRRFLIEWLVALGEWRGSGKGSLLCGGTGETPSESVEEVSEEGEAEVEVVEVEIDFEESEDVSVKCEATSTSRSSVPSLRRLARYSWYCRCPSGWSFLRCSRSHHTGNELCWRVLGKGFLVAVQGAE